MTDYARGYKDGARAYRKKPVVIEAIQYTLATRRAIIDWVGDNCHGSMIGNDGESYETEQLRIHTRKGTMLADLGDWIIKGVKGEFYPCKPDIFAATYEPALPLPTPAPSGTDLAAAGVTTQGLAASSPQSPARWQEGERLDPYEYDGPVSVGGLAADLGMLAPQPQARRQEGDDPLHIKAIAESLERENVLSYTQGTYLLSLLRASRPEVAEAERAVVEAALETSLYMGQNASPSSVWQWFMDRCEKLRALRAAAPEERQG